MLILSHYKIGDKYAVVLSNGLKSMAVSSVITDINLSSNRLSDRGVA